jgi:alkylation response protein AidB-like acyl-CoA dehydrogenase
VLKWPASDDLRPTDEQRLLRQTVREFAEAEMAPHTLEWDEAQRFSLELVPKFADLGLMGIQFPERHGGATMGAVDYCICIEELARVDPSIALSVSAHNGLAAAHIYMFGTDAQRDRYLTLLAWGRHLGALALTEPQAGSDAGDPDRGGAMVDLPRRVSQE